MKVLSYWRKILAAGSLFITGVASADMTLNMRKGVTDLSNEIFDLHMLVLWLCVAIGVVVFSLMIYSMIAHRKSKNPVPATFHESTTVEIAWTIIPLAILIAIAIPATKTLLKLEDATDADVHIKVTGYQWRWHYDYIDEGVSFFSQLSDESNNARQLGASTPAGLASAFPLDANGKDQYLLDVDNPIVIPVGKKVAFLVTSNDVIHAWWSPDLGVKQDAVPGYINDTWAIANEPGVYRGQCAELCGKDHGFMPIVVIAKPEAEYKEWIASKQAEAMAEAMAADANANKTFTKDALMASGEALYVKNCGSCHGVMGESLIPIFPSLKGSAVVTGSVAEHLDIVINGSKVNPAMAAYGAQLSDADLAAIITFERNAWGNSTGDIVQPADIAAAK